MVSQLLADVLTSAQQHHRVLLEEQWVVDIGIASSHGSLVDDDVLGLPDLEDWHTGDRAVWVLEGRGVDDVVGSDDQDHIDVREVVVDLFHFLDNVIGDADLCKEDVHLSGHASSHWMDGESHLYSVLRQVAGQFSNSVLSLGDSHSIAWHDDHVFAVDKQFCNLLSISLDMLTGLSSLGLDNT